MTYYKNLIILNIPISTPSSINFFKFILYNPSSQHPCQFIPYVSMLAWARVQLKTIIWWRHSVKNDGIAKSMTIFSLDWHHGLAAGILICIQGYTVLIKKIYNKNMYVFIHFKL